MVQQLPKYDSVGATSIKSAKGYMPFVEETLRTKCLGPRVYE